MQKTGSFERHPFEWLLLLLVLMVLGWVIFSLLALLLSHLIYGIPASLFAPEIDFQGNTGVMRILQIVSATGTFIIPAFVWARILSRRPATLLKLDTTAPLLLFVLVPLLVIGSAPFLEWAIQWNKQMKLPAALQTVEQWMRLKEDEMAGITKQLLAMKNPADLAINLLMVAIIPAIGEELVFRAGIQQSISRWMKNHHAGIWITAIIFSAIHLQFYGFIPRMLLGAMLGYLFVWARSLWIPILAHFINNAAGIIAAYVYQQKGLPVEKADELNTGSWQLYAGSFLFSVVLLAACYAIYRKQTILSPHTPSHS